jgi:hypothetical protein
VPWDILYLWRVIGQLTNEFEFPLAAFHHASEAWLVPDLLKKTYVVFPYPTHSG